MDLTEAGQRIVKRHWALLLICMLLGLAAVLAYTSTRAAGYVGVARVDLGPDARGGQDATSLGDTALGLASSPQQLTTALEQAGVRRSVDQMILDHVVQVDPVGTSGVLDVSVTDRDPRAAAAIANSLATQIVQQRDQAKLGALQERVGQLQAQSDALTKQINDVVAQTRRYYYTVPSLQAQQEALQAQRTVVDQEAQLLQQALLTAERPRVVDASEQEGTPVPTRLKVLLPIGLLLGLLVGVCLAAIAEAAAPSLTPETLARRLDAPVLGRLRNGFDGRKPVDPWIANYIGIAARAAGVQTVQLVPVGPRPGDVSGLAEALDEALENVRIVPLVLPQGRHRRRGEPIPWSDAGIVVVSRTVVKEKYLRSLERHLTVTAQRVLGVLTYRGRLAGALGVGAAGKPVPAHVRAGSSAVRPAVPAGPARP